MLRFLSIRRLAVIDSVDMEFDPGLNVLTGETGAGKSILVGAVGLLLGGRASGDLVRTGEDTATVEALFDRNGEETAVRREITAQGRSRAFVNGSLTTAAALKDLSSALIELHGQHEHQTLLDPSTHLTVLDDYAGLGDVRTRTLRAFTELCSSVKDLEAYKKSASERAGRREVLAYELSEIERVGPRAGEDDELARTREILANAERIERLCTEAYAALYEQDNAVLSTLGAVWRRVVELADIDPQFKAHLDARDEIKARLEDLALLLRHYLASEQPSQARLQEVEERLAALERLKRKYGPTLSAVLSHRDALKAEQSALGDAAGGLATLEARTIAARQAYLSAASVLSLARRDAARGFVPQVERLLGELAMEQSRVEVRFGETLAEGSWTAAGVDQAELFISPNPGEDLRPLARIASGGELSRIMMAIKTLTAASRHGFSDAFARQPGTAAPGLIFDEVDAGIGGRVADVVGRKLRTLGSAFQVLCITHLPQIAAYADTQFAVAKRVSEGRTTTTVTRLDDPGRVRELSRMLGGEGVTEAIEASAREMLVGRRAAAPALAGAKVETIPKGESESVGSESKAGRRSGAIGGGPRGRRGGAE
jgi:DNA repair protein RecN (Recombination protein N)